MGYRNLQSAVVDLERTNRLVRIDHEIDPDIEMGVIQRRVYQAGGPALLFTRAKGCAFPMLGNLFGTLDRTRYLFRDSLDAVETLVKLKLNPAHLIKHPSALLRAPLAAKNLLPRRVSSGPVMMHRTSIDKLPQLKSWPRDGGAFITLPQVYSEQPSRPGLRHSNLGMYRVQLGGNQYRTNEEVGLHYQIHRGIGVHHAEAIASNQPLRVNIFVGGPPSMTVAAVMPLPEGMPEISFAGLLGGHRIAMTGKGGALPIPAEADFCICGTIDPSRTLPEGPFGDHLGYYSLVHDFPVLKVDAIYHRPDAIWPFTSVGRPPQEDSSFGAFIHELTGDLIPDVLPGVHAVHAVDASGVHPLLLALGSERYVPYASKRRPQELLTLGNAILGQGQLSLAKYLLIAAREDDQSLDIHDAGRFLVHLLERIDWRRDLHFQTRTTIDTLDYSGTGFNEGSKVVMAAAGEKRRELPVEIPTELSLPEGFSNPQVAAPGIMTIEGPPCTRHCPGEDPELMRFCGSFDASSSLCRFPLVVIADDAGFAAQNLENFIWVTFTRSDPAADIYGVDAFTDAKHWGAMGAVVIDARIKPHHAPSLDPDPEVEARVDALAAKGGPLHGLY